MNKIDVLLGLQWGDEGKGKIVDLLTPQYGIVARFQGGPNAGHTLEFDGRHVVLRSIPSGIFQCKGINVIGNGVVFDPVLFKQEVQELLQYIPLSELRTKICISNACHVITPLHKAMDKIDELIKGGSKVGTTGKGIGPTYSTKSSRFGIRLGDIIDDPSKANDQLCILENMMKASASIVDDYSFNADKLLNQMAEWTRAVKWIKETGFAVIDTVRLINNSLKNGSRILAEGAQGTMLDIDHGTYPFVTSSNTSCGGVCTGLGIAPNRVGKVYGIFKAYCTRVGSGPFPTEDLTEYGKRMRDVGHEYGAVTGRERRCGWLDLDLLQYSCMINGVTDLIMMKADVLSGFDKIKIFVNGEYKEFDSWDADELKNAKTYDELPKTFRDYVKFIEKTVDVPVTIISTGPDRTETIIR
ncbi:MAG: adenylosuccinate synthetase [Wendovervirus sonii]|uniref:Adenylosuccinate synthetase n=1 Tax=phage Lak_Megaphage_Sonny TaxID=3109229 RepID=A0ABZ0Z288_9CAUD|nr:MAG: adenylosuccinate synthetase [phage Lak_Megaphage_Sonny]